MRKSTLLGAIAVAAVFAGVWYFASRERGLTTDGTPSPQGDRSGVAAGTSAAPAAGAGASAAPSDPRLQALGVSPDNGLIEFVRGANGKVIREVDNDPGSARYGKSLREYTYLGDQVVVLTTFKHLGNQIQVTRIRVAYTPDGAIDQFVETTDYEPAPKSR